MPEVACVIFEMPVGTINAVVLTVEYIRNHGMDAKGIILNHYSGGAMRENNENDREINGVPVIARSEMVTGSLS